MRLFLYGACASADLIIACLAGPGWARWGYVAFAALFCAFAVLHNRIEGKS